MKGDQISGDPSDLVEQMTEKKLLQLRSEISPPFGRFSEFGAALGELAGKELAINFGKPGLHFSWGRIVAYPGDATTVPDAEEAMYFLANYDLIRERLLKFVE